MHSRDSLSSPQPSSEGAKSKKNKHRRANVLLKRATNEWNNFWTRIRSLSDVVLAVQDDFDELFVSSDSDGEFEQLAKVNRGYTSAEETFLRLYKKHKNLEKMYEYHQQANDEVRSSTTMGSESPNSPDLGIIRKGAITELQHEGESTTVESTNYEDLDICKLREQMESQQLSLSRSSKLCLGEKLWDYRRNAWLTPTKNEDEVEAHIEDHSLAHVPREALPKIYTNLVDRGRVLKEDKHVNLKDLTRIINAGWIAEEKWERAAKGLP